MHVFNPALHFTIFYFEEGIDLSLRKCITLLKPNLGWNIGYSKGYSDNTYSS